tara:strand:+ start:472 stop:1011 length:540 start_codon:yes stop_codon:yes gene_type:complete
MKLLLITSLVLVSKQVLAAGNGGHGSPMDLVWPAINFLALFVFLVIKLRKPLTETFNRQATDVQSTYEMAEKKDKEAQIKLETYQKKMSGFERERERVLSEATKEGEQAVSAIERETIEAIEKLKVDADSKVAHERDQLTKQLNEGLVDEVIKLARQKIGGSKDNQSKATEKLVHNIGR